MSAKIYRINQENGDFEVVIDNGLSVVTRGIAHTLNTTGGLDGLFVAETGLKLFTEPGWSLVSFGGNVQNRWALMWDEATDTLMNYDAGQQKLYTVNQVTGDETDRHVFKVPSLRNIDKTAPYFHDGSIATLDEAIRLMAAHQLGVDLTDEQAAQIETFLVTLTGVIDPEFIAAPEPLESGPDTPAPDPS